MKVLEMEPCRARKKGKGAQTAPTAKKIGAAILSSFNDETRLRHIYKCGDVVCMSYNSNVLDVVTDHLTHSPHRTHAPGIGILINGPVCVTRHAEDIKESARPSCSTTPSYQLTTNERRLVAAFLLSFLMMPECE
jgi:hypothetical protein